MLWHCLKVFAMTACISESFSIDVRRRTRAGKPCWRMRNLRRDWVSHVMEVDQFYCPSEVVSGLKKQRMGIQHQTDTDALEVFLQGGRKLQHCKETESM